MPAKWTEQKTNSFIFDFQNYLPVEEMMKKYKMKKLSIYTKSCKLNCHRKRNHLTSVYNKNDKNNKILELYNSGLSASKISIEVDKSINYIYKTLKFHNVITRDLSHCNRKYGVNENYFEVIDTEDKAYFLGFLYADGYNNEKRNLVQLTLQERDVEILNKFNIYLKSNYNLLYIEQNYGNRKNQYSLRISSKKLSENLVRLGCMQAKTTILQFPTEEQVPSHLHNHFIRGYFDGDGSIYGAKYKTDCGFNLTGNKDFIEECQKILMKNCNLNNTKLYYKKSETANTVSLKYHGRFQLKRIFNYLYFNSNLYLERKYKRFIQYTGYFN